MGKSAVANMLRVMRIPVFDSDACVRGLLSGDAVTTVKAAFPAAWDTISQRIDRKKLGQIVFRDPAARAHLESLLHPLVWNAQREFIAARRRAGQKLVALDIPLLFETGRDRICDYVICVSAPHFVQKSRVLARPHMTEALFHAILHEQMADRQKQLLADITIPTGAGRHLTFARLQKALHAIRDTQQEDTL